MAIDPPYRLDPFQNIVNVSWRSGDFGLAIFLFNSSGSGSYPSIIGGWSFDSSYYSVGDTTVMAAYRARYAELTASNVPYYSTIMYTPPPNDAAFETLDAAKAVAADTGGETHHGDFWSFYYMWNYVWQFNFSKTSPPKGFVIAGFLSETA